jgi:APA family basic amino acid/polyamine antiporter
LTYAELAAAMPRSGGEYTYLGELFHPALGFLSGWVSGTVAFAAPMALSAMAFGRYMSAVFPAVSPQVLGLTALLGVSAVHLWSGDKGARFLNLWTAIKILPIAVIVVFGLFLVPSAGTHFGPVRADLGRLVSPGFAVSLVYVSYAYSGWNASTYLAGEVSLPARNVPRSILFGTAIVTGLYLLLNAAFCAWRPFPTWQEPWRSGTWRETKCGGRRGGCLSARRWDWGWWRP